MSPIQKKDPIKKVTSPEEELDEEHTLAEAGFEEAKNMTPSPSSPVPQEQRQSTGHFVAPIPEDFLSGDGSFLNVVNSMNNNLGLQKQLSEPGFNLSNKSGLEETVHYRMRLELAEKRIASLLDELKRQ